MTDAIVLLILVVIVTMVIRYLIKEKKKGHTCVGCPNAGSCSRCSMAIKQGMDEGKK